MQGRSIKTLRELKQAAIDKKAVFVPNSMWAKKPSPAAWVINYSGAQLNMLFQTGMYIYKRDTK